MFFLILLSRTTRERLFFQVNTHCIEHRCCIIFRLDFRVGDLYIQDQFVWDMGNPEANPELFARVYCEDLNLDCQIASRIAWHIREQLYKIKRSHKSKGAELVLIVVAA